MKQSAILPTALFVALATVAAACGGSDESSGASSSDPVETEANAGEPAGDSAPAERNGDATGILTLGDGTVYSFEMTTCITSATDPSSFLIEVGFDAFGRSSDGFTLQAIRAAFEESPELQPTVGFEGRYDENGVNPEITYLRDGDAELQIDGGRIFGTVTFRDFFSVSPIHGDGFTADIDISC